MNDDRRDRQLTESQKACLRLVLEHKTSKEIAQVLGISPNTVDMHVKDAMRRLGAATRVQAAKMAFAGEVIPPQPLVYQSPAIAGGTTPPPVSTPPQRERVVPSGSWFPHVGGENAGLTSSARLLWIGGIAIAAILALAGLLSSLDAVSRYLAR